MYVIVIWMFTNLFSYVWAIYKVFLHEETTLVLTFARNISVTPELVIVRTFMTELRKHIVSFQKQLYLFPSGKYPAELDETGEKEIMEYKKYDPIP